ncbi:uncharacterized protein LOC119294942 isoform X1 [Triticum dicoccoides]|uniref:uncharacterized protein LOC119294942 isoform X1 n=1 Tax=Triticum dicoccoides TaxID=85692 RepID=UPI00188E188A|nr:uncharacterized protein LOC119294942 isoform X1 [Triticum dicoccoides]
MDADGELKLPAWGGSRPPPCFARAWHMGELAAINDGELGGSRSTSDHNLDVLQDLDSQGSLCGQPPGRRRQPKEGFLRIRLVQHHDRCRQQGLQRARHLGAGASVRWRQGLLFGIGCKNSHGLTWSGSGEVDAHGVAALQDGPHRQEGSLRKSHLVILEIEDAGQDLITQSMNLWTLSYIPWFRGSLTTRTNLELLSTLAGIAMTRPPRSTYKCLGCSFLMKFKG